MGNSDVQTSVLNICEDSSVPIVVFRIARSDAAAWQHQTCGSAAVQQQLLLLLKWIWVIELTGSGWNTDTVRLRVSLAVATKSAHIQFINKAVVPAVLSSKASHDIHVQISKIVQAVAGGHMPIFYSLTLTHLLALSLTHPASHLLTQLQCS